MSNDPKFVSSETVRDWLNGSNSYAGLFQSIGARHLDRDFLENDVGIPPHLRFIIQKLSEQDGQLSVDALDSISFYSLCRGLFLPLSALTPEKALSVFGIVQPRLNTEAREALVTEFFERPIGLTGIERTGCVLGDPFLGRPSTFRQDSLLRLLRMLTLTTRREQLTRLAQVADVGILFAESRPALKFSPQLTAAEVLRTLSFLPKEKINEKFRVLKSILNRCGKLEAFFLARLLMSRTGLGFEFQRPFLARILGKQFRVADDAVQRALCLTDIFKLTQILETEGPEGLRKIQLQPLSPIKPALASGKTSDLEHFPVWTELKYDGVRMLLHKSTDQRGNMLTGAYTRNGNDWLEMIQGLDSTIRSLPCASIIVDGELHGTLHELGHSRPATVYDVMSSIRGEGSAVSLRYSAFDLLYFNGSDLTEQPLSNRREFLASLIQSVSHLRLPIPVNLAQGQIANSHEDVNRLYHHFRSQGHEGVITKQLEAPYCLGGRDPNWLKRKPELTLDLVLLGATFAVTSNTGAAFGSWIIAARDAQSYVDVGDVDGVDQIRDAQICDQILLNNLLTGRTIERKLTEGTRIGVEIRPLIVVTVLIQGIQKDSRGTLTLRHPRIAVVRTDKRPEEANTMQDIRDLAFSQAYC